MIKNIGFKALQYIVGTLFIFSGLIKLNDPVGTQIKLEEYFNVFATDFSSIFTYFIPFALILSVFLCVVEVVLGIMLLIKAYLSITIKSLIIIIVFFTILTGYSAITNNVTDCGCFGDAIKLTPWESFFKDVFLGICIYGLMVLQPKNISANIWKLITTVSATIVSIIIAIIAVSYLPFIDFRPYAIGEDVKTKMKPSAPYVYEYHFTTPEGEKKVFDSYPTIKGYKLDTMIHINPEAKPKIVDFALWDSKSDRTEEILQNKHVIITIQKTEKITAEEWNNIQKQLFLLNTNITDAPWQIITSSNSQSVTQLITNDSLKNLPVIYADATVLKAIIRSNVGLVVFNNGIVKGKWHSNALPTTDELKSSLQ